MPVKTVMFVMRLLSTTAVCLLVSTFAAAQTIAFRNATSGNLNTISPVVNAPALLADGDLILISFGLNDVVTLNGSPTLNGFTVLGGAVTATADSSGSGAVLYKVASGEGASWTFTNLWSAITTGTYVSVAYSGVNTSTPINQSAQSTPAASTTPATSSVTPNVDGCMVVGLFGGDAVSGTSGTADTSPAATERGDQEFGGGGHSYVEDYLQATAALVALDFTATNSVAYVATIIALQPAGGGGGPAAPKRLLLLGSGVVAIVFPAFWRYKRFQKMFRRKS